MRLHFGVPWLDIGSARQQRLLNASMRSKNADVAIASAWLCALLDCEIRKPTREIHPLANIILKENGKLRRVDTQVCGIRLALHEMTDIDISINWRKFFGKTIVMPKLKLSLAKVTLRQIQQLG